MKYARFHLHAVSNAGIFTEIESMMVISRDHEGERCRVLAL